MQDDDLFTTLLLLYGPPNQGWFYDNEPEATYGVRISIGSLKYKDASHWRHEVRTALEPYTRAQSKKFCQYLRWLHAKGAIDLTPPRTRVWPV